MHGADFPAHPSSSSLSPPCVRAITGGQGGGRAGGGPGGRPPIRAQGLFRQSDPRDFRRPIGGRGRQSTPWHFSVAAGGRGASRRPGTFMVVVGPGANGQARNLSEWRLAVGVTINNGNVSRGVCQSSKSLWPKLALQYMLDFGSE